MFSLITSQCYKKLSNRVLRLFFLESALDVDNCSTPLRIVFALLARPTFRAVLICPLAPKEFLERYLTDSHWFK